MNTTPSGGQLSLKKHLSSSILLSMRTDQPRQTGMDYWKGPHWVIISATPGLEKYRQIHLAERVSAAVISGSSSRRPSYPLWPTQGG